MRLYLGYPLTDLRPLLGRHMTGRHDPTVGLDATTFRRSAHTPDGPGAIYITLVDRGVTEVECHGPGGGWLQATVEQLLGVHDDLPTIEPHHSAVAAALRKSPLPRMSASKLVLPSLVAGILGQRVTSGEAIGQWAALCRVTAATAPGPQHLLLPPDPTVLATLPSWSFHRAGVERSRADTIALVACRVTRVEEVAKMSMAEGHARLEAFRGVGPWTAAVTMKSAMGDPDAVAVGDFHLKNVIAYALTGAPRGSDEQMLELLKPYAGQRGRVIELLLRSGWTAPKFGPRQRIHSMTKW